jgi:hypothetical protein
VRLIYTPQAALEAVEALLARYARGKYATAKWMHRTTGQHLAAVLRHGAGAILGRPDDESGESHAVHLAARALQMVAVEQMHGPGRADPFELLAAALEVAACAADELRAEHPDYATQQWLCEVGKLAAWAERKRRPALVSICREG